MSIPTKSGPKRRRTGAAVFFRADSKAQVARWKAAAKRARRNLGPWLIEIAEAAAELPEKLAAPIV